MAGSRSTNHGRKGQREHPPMTKKKRTEDDRRHHYGNSDVENEMNGEESSLENSRTSKDQREANWAREEEDNDSVGQYEVCTNGSECILLEEELAEGKKAYNILLAQWGGGGGGG
jgi:hypothetical protein